MHLLSAGIQHETNTFANTPTTLDDFRRDSLCGDDFGDPQVIAGLYQGTETIHGGYLDAAQRQGVRITPLLVAKAQPAGRVTREAFAFLRDRMLERISAALPADGLLFDLHGAMVTDDHEDAESELLAAVRELTGPDLPLIVTLDLHANTSRRFTELCDLYIGFDTYPHVDMGDRGREAVNLMARLIRGEIQPVTAFRQLPLITLPPRQCTLREPMQTIMAEVAAVETHPDILTATLAMGFPFADIADAGVSIAVHANCDPELAAEKADHLAEVVWNTRDELLPELTPVDTLIQFARQNSRGLIVYADGSDNPGGGAPCDGTVILQALIDDGFPDAVVGVLYDPETVQQAHTAGTGALIDARIGGKTDDRHGSPVEMSARVKALGDGRFVHHGPMRRGLEGNLGPMAVLKIGGVHVVLASRRQQLLDAEMLRVVGIEPDQHRLLVVKSAVHFRADFTDRAAYIFDADTPGIHRPDFAAFDYRHLRRPIAPLDEVADWRTD